LLVALLALLSGGLWYGWSYTQSQYYVGVTKNGTIAVFRGVPGQIAGLHLSSVQVSSQRNVDDLTPVAQNNVKQGIPFASESDARRKLDELTSEDPANNNLKPPCHPSASASDQPANPSTGPTPPASGGAISPIVSSPTPAAASETPSESASASPGTPCRPN
jgi:protein phosphatase